VTLPATVASQLLRETGERLDDPATLIETPELRAMLGRLRSAQRNARPDELAPLFNAIGIVCYRLRDFRDALDAHRNAARYDTSNAGYLSNAAACLCELKQLPQALAALREAKARPRKSPGSEVCILSNTAELEHHLGNLEEARVVFEAAVRSVDPARSSDLFNVATTAAVLGADEDAAELFARSIAVAKGIDLGETPAIELVLADPDGLKIARARSLPLGDALTRVAARHNAQIPPEHQLTTQISLPHAALTALNGLVEHPPIPTDTLRRVFDDDSRA
jgi:tetratricopeptide (TPR) repeat protein